MFLYYAKKNWVHLINTLKKNTSQIFQICAALIQAVRLFIFNQSSLKLTMFQNKLEFKTLHALSVLII